jgi:protein-disulfide isomerase
VTISRRHTLILGATAAAAGLAGLTPARAQGEVTIDPAKLMAPVGLPDHVLGNKDAKVTVIEYGSAQCPHCGNFHRDVFPELKSKYIDTGKIKFIFRPFALSIYDVVVFMLAEIAGPDQFYTVLDAYYDNQEKWDFAEYDPSRTKEEADAIKAIALQLGFTEDSYKQALTNRDWPQRIQDHRDQAVNDFKVTGTPTFFVNGKQMVGEQTIDELAAAIDPLLA